MLPREGDEINRSARGEALSALKDWIPNESTFHNTHVSRLNCKHVLKSWSSADYQVAKLLL